jgi:TRAP-type C4-dicarboxylate transport system permease small subunit
MAERGADSEPGLVPLLRRADVVLARLEEVALAISLAVMILLGVYQAIKRNFFGASPFWIDEVIRWSVFFVGLTGGALAAQSDRMINIDMCTRLFSPRGKLILRILTALFTVTVCWLFIDGSMIVRDILAAPGEEGEVIRPGTAWLALPIAMGLIAVHMLLHAAADVIYLVTGRIPPEILEGAPKE